MPKKKNQSSQDSSSPAKKIDETTRYAEDVKAGRIIAGAPVRLACIRHLEDIKNQKQTGLDWRFETAQKAMEFFSEMLTVEVRNEVKPFNLEPFQRFIVGSIFGWYNADGTRRFRTAYIEIGKGNGKTPLAAGIGIYGLIADGEASPEVYSAATTQDQARIAFKDATAMVARNAELGGIIARSVGSLYYGDRNGVFRPLSSEHKALDGKRVHIAIIDELHEHATSLVVDKMRAGTKARRNALIFEITNSGSDLETVCYHHHEYSLNILNGIAEDPSWFAYVCALDEGDDWRDESVWTKVNPGLGAILPIQYLREQVREADGMPSKQNIVKRLNFCIWTQQHTIWIQLESWDPCKGELEKDVLNLHAFGGLDLSTKLDLTAFVVAVKRDAPGIPETTLDVGEPDYGTDRKLTLNFGVDIHPFFWIPEATMHEREKADRVPYSLWVEQGLVRATPGTVVDYDFIFEQIKREIAPRFNLQAIGYDPTNATQFVLHLQAAGFEMVEINQNIQNLSEPCKVLEALIISKRLRHDGNPVLRWNVSNVAVKEDWKGNLFPFKQHQKKRIDGVSATIFALNRLVATVDEGPSIYETQELLVL